MAILVLAIAIILSTIIPTLVSALVTKSLGLGVPTIELGVWGPKLKSRLGNSAITITPWLFTSSYAIKDSSNLEQHANAPGESFYIVNPLLRAAIIVCGPLSVLLACTLVLGTKAFPEFTSGFSQILAGYFSPLGHAQVFLSGFWHTASVNPLTSVATLLTKFVAFALLPFPSLPGGNAILQLLRWRRSNYPQHFRTLLQFGLLCVLLLALSWSVAFVWYLFHGSAN